MWVAAIGMWGVGAVHAQLSGTVGVVSLYKSRGVDQDGRNQDFRPALQGGLRYTWGSGFYVGNWNSTGRFGKARAEIDLYAGFGGEWGGGWSYDVGYVHYLYPSESAWNSGDIYGGVSYGNARLYIYRGTRRNVNKSDMYYVLGYKHPLTERLSLTAGLGFLDYGDAALRSKTDASLGLEFALQPKVILSVKVEGANRRHAVDDGSRDVRGVVGLRMDF